MVETITPVVHGGRRARYWRSVAVHIVGAGAAAAAFGALLGGLGALAGGPWVWGPGAVAAVAAVYALRELARLPIPIPDRKRQVPDWWRTFYSPATAAALYGVGLGVGFLTFLTFGTFVAVAAGALLSGDPLLGAALSAPFGIARGASVAVSASAAGGEEAARLVDRLEATAESWGPRVVNGTALVVVALVGAAAAL